MLPEAKATFESLGEDKFRIVLSLLQCSPAALWWQQSASNARSCARHCQSLTADHLYLIMNPTCVSISNESISTTTGPMLNM